MSAAEPQVVVRRAHSDDLAALHELAQAVAELPLLRRYGARAERLAQDLAQLAGTTASPAPPTSEELWVAGPASPDQTEPLLGFARVQLGPSAAHGHFGRGGYLRLIALRPGQQGRGTGQKLLAAVEETVRARHPDLFLLTSDFNTAAQRFYERAGYARVGALPDFVQAGITEIIYWKRLHPQAGSAPSAAARG